MPEDNDLTRELVLRVHGRGFAQRIVHVSPKERLGGLFEQEREPEQFREIAEGDDWLLVWERDLPDWVVSRVLLDIATEEENAR